MQHNAFQQNAFQGDGGPRKYPGTVTETAVVSDAFDSAVLPRLKIIQAVNGNDDGTNAFVDLTVNIPAGAVLVALTSASSISPNVPSFAAQGHPGQLALGSNTHTYSNFALVNGSVGIAVCYNTGSDLTNEVIRCSCTGAASMAARAVVIQGADVSNLSHWGTDAIFDVASSPGAFSVQITNCNAGSFVIGVINAWNSTFTASADAGTQIDFQYDDTVDGGGAAFSLSNPYTTTVGTYTLSGTISSSGTGANNGCLVCVEIPKDKIALSGPTETAVVTDSFDYTRFAGSGGTLYTASLPTDTAVVQDQFAVVGNQQVSQPTDTAVVQDQFAVVGNQQVSQPTDTAVVSDTFKAVGGQGVSQPTDTAVVSDTFKAVGGQGVSQPTDTAVVSDNFDYTKFPPGSLYPQSQPTDTAVVQDQFAVVGNQQVSQPTDTAVVQDQFAVVGGQGVSQPTDTAVVQDSFKVVGGQGVSQPTDTAVVSDQVDARAAFAGVLSPTTNLLPYSEPTVAQLGPNGGVTDVAFAPFDNGLYFSTDTSIGRYAYEQYTGVVGQYYTFSAIVRMDDGGAPVPGLSTDITADFEIILNGANLNTVEQRGVTALSDNYYRVWGYANIASNAVPNWGLARYTTQSGRAFTVSAYQLEFGIGPSQYVKTTGVSATLYGEAAAVVDDFAVVGRQGVSQPTDTAVVSDTVASAQATQASQPTDTAVVSDLFDAQRLGGATLYQVSIPTDTAVVSDTFAVVGRQGVSQPADTAVVSDTVASAQATQASQPTDTAVVSDTVVSAQATQASQPTDTATAKDIVQHSVGSQGTISDAAVATDSFAQALKAAGQVSDAAVVTDQFASGQQSGTSQPTDTAVVSDAFDLFIQGAFSIKDTAVVSDAFDSTFTFILKPAVPLTVKVNQQFNFTVQVQNPNATTFIIRTVQMVVLGPPTPNYVEVMPLQWDQSFLQPNQVETLQGSGVIFATGSYTLRFELVDWLRRSWFATAAITVVP